MYHCLKEGKVPGSRPNGRGSRRLTPHPKRPTHRSNVLGYELEGPPAAKVVREFVSFQSNLASAARHGRLEPVIEFVVCVKH